MKTGALSCLALASLLGVAQPGLARNEQGVVTEPVVNGLLTSVYPNVGLFFTGSGTCTGTLIGCSTVLTAAHCLCEDPGNHQLLSGAQCLQRPDLLDPSHMLVFFQHAGFFNVSAVNVNPAFQFENTGDVAILHLSSPVTGVAPASINTAGRPPLGSPGRIVGFGTTRDSLGDVGLKRTGVVTTGPCSSEVNGSRHVCWSFTQPVGAPGDDSDTCTGDSGGPLFMDSGAGLVLAGVTSGGISTECVPPDDSWDADVFLERAWIQSQAGGDLGASACGGLPAAGTAAAPTQGAVAALDAGDPEFRTTFEVPPGTRRLRVALNAEHYDANDFDLYLAAGSPVTPSHVDCGSEEGGSLEFCEVASPAPGTWHLLARRVTGGGPFQLTKTLFSDSGPGPGVPCTRDGGTACLASGRFEVKVSWQNSGGNGNGQVMSFGGQRTENDEAAFYSFQSPTNFEMGVKILTACIPLFGNKYWVFISGLTDQGWTVTVRDTRTGATKTYNNAAGHLSTTFADTAAFNCN